MAEVTVESSEEGCTGDATALGGQIAPWMTTWLFIAATGVFLAVHYRLAVDANAFVIQVGGQDVIHHAEVAPGLLGSMSRFVALSLAAIGIAHSQRRLLFIVMLLTYAFLPALVGGPSGCTPFAEPTIIAVGADWRVPPPCSYPMAASPLGVVVDLSLVATPAVWLAFSLLRREKMADPVRPGTDSTTYMSIGICLFFLVMIMWSEATSSFVPYPWYLDGAVYGSMFMFGALMGFEKPAWSWLLFLVPFMLWTNWVPALAMGEAPPTYGLGHQLAVVLSPCLGAMWRFVERLIIGLRGRPLLLLIAVNIVNVLDAILSSSWISHGLASESNPVVRAIGMPLKVVAVAGVTVILYRIRPRALIWPLFILIAVIGWHIAGFTASP